MSKCLSSEYERDANTVGYMSKLSRLYNTDI